MHRNCVIIFICKNILTTKTLVLVNHKDQSVLKITSLFIGLLLNANKQLG